MTYEYPRYYGVMKGNNDTLIFDWQSQKTSILTDEERDSYKKIDNSTETRQKLLNVGKSESHVETFSLETTVVHTVPVPLNSEQRIEYRKKLDNFERLEKERIELINKRNELETMIYNRKDFLNSEEGLKHLKEEEIENCRNTLEEAGTWYEDEGFNASSEDVIKKTNQIVEAFKMHDDRVNTKKSVNLFIKTFLEDVEKEQQRFLKIIEKKTWLASRQDSFMKHVEEAKQMLQEEKTLHYETPLNEVYL